VRAGLWLAAGMLVKSTMVIQVPIVAVFLAMRVRQGTVARDTRGAVAAVARLLAGPLAAVLLLGIYNLWRFGSVSDSGYDPTVDTFSTPLLVGLYGQLLSSGKSLFLYAPLALAALWGWARLWRRDTALAVAAAAMLLANLILHARFASWAGEGSWGPRYLVPFLPWFLLAAAELYEAGGHRRRRALTAALVLGMLVQVGGSAIYFGSYMRDLGEYPYQRGFKDPLFMVRSHFVPNYTPVVGHWRLLLRNAAILTSDRRPDLRPQVEVSGRLPLAPEDRDELRYVIDYWFCYGIYAGLPALPMLLAALVMVSVTTAVGLRLRQSARRIRSGTGTGGGGPPAGGLVA
jgi:hypothetical protein